MQGILQPMNSCPSVCLSLFIPLLQKSSNSFLHMIEGHIFPLLMQTETEPHSRGAWVILLYLNHFCELYTPHFTPSTSFYFLLHHLWKQRQDLPALQRQESLCNTQRKNLKLQMGKGRKAGRS